MDLDTFTARTIATADGCLMWMGSRTKDQYGKFSNIYVHRWSYEHHVGPIPDGYEVDHLCGRAWCVLPAHLEPVTKQENMRRAGLRITECKNGHPYTDENTYVTPKTGRKSCRTCRAETTRRFLERNPGYHAEWKRQRKSR